MNLNLKPIFIFIVSLLIFNEASAQKDTAVYYLNNAGKVVSTKDSADFFLLILPPDTSVDKSLFVVKEYYHNGKIRLMGNSATNNLDLKFQGPMLTFFPNGHRKRISNYEKGTPFGDETEYYPNGKLYNIKNYSLAGNVILTQCSDSAGSVLAKQGQGKWIIYDENFKEIYAEGSIYKGLYDGAWKGKINDSVDFEREFNQGKLISNKTLYKYKPNGEIFTKVDVVPEFAGGIEQFYRFLARTIRYPAVARENGVQGRVIVQFIVEKDGTLNDVKIAKGIGSGCDEEAKRVIELSSPWLPGLQNGKPARVTYSVPISFTLATGK
ncbi:MAG TPA: TonB family protein [Mucilaginibacter sp.]|jgi:TonB family protein